MSVYYLFISLQKEWIEYKIKVEVAHLQNRENEGAKENF